MDYTQKFLSEIEKLPNEIDWLEKVNDLDALEKIDFKRISDTRIENKVFHQDNFDFYFFTTVTFIDCFFEEVFFSNCAFEDCTFENCKFRNITFEETQIYRSNFTEILFYQSSFLGCEIFDSLMTKCTFSQNIVFINTTQVDVAYYDSSIYNVQFYLSADLGLQLITFWRTKLGHTTFDGFDLTKSEFDFCILENCVFSRSVLNRTCFKNATSASRNAFCSVDLSTLNSSEELPYNVLKDIFGIQSPDIQAYTKEMVSKMEFHTVFISYSFADKHFAKKLNESLLNIGVFTFLWEKDAPGGKRLKHIMSANIQKMDKILFIASKNSLKSQACQFELMEARTKYEKNWEDVFFPIHIDNYLFEVRDFQIPLDVRTEFWKNIVQLREFNSLDFSVFNHSQINELEFQKQTEKLAYDLRKKV